MTKTRSRKPKPVRGFRWLLRRNGLTLALLSLFTVSLFGQAIAGFLADKAERERTHQPTEDFRSYLVSSDFWSATGENWESEFLQMFFFIWMTTFLFQKGSPESNDPDEPKKPNSKPHGQNTPWPVKRGGWVLAVYAHSLSLAFLALFVASFTLHLFSGARHYSEELARNGLAPVSAFQYLRTSRLWFESLQNWQSEFLAVASMVFLAVYLRERGSPESKAVESAHEEHE